ncbi:MAG: polysaccharide deacetylase family protein [Verrucomicrobia bacterium]|nr:polysaccharide deacetylase family protein [Verrucomicrobiota bacterium]
MNKIFLFSIDLEEFYAVRSNFRRTPLPHLTESYLEFLKRHNAKTTFFIVGELAEQFKSTIRDIAAEGHELACHTFAHRSLDQYNATSLREDLLRNMEALRNCADVDIVGFRAPILSLTERTQWAYDVLAELGFKYSCSVLPSENPLHGWPGFGNKPKMMSGVLEIPVTLARFMWLRVPIGAGTYFRCLPMSLIGRAFRRCAEDGVPVAGYFHPYDIDTGQERVMSRGVGGSRTLNSLLYVNRGRTMRKLEVVMADGFRIMPYRDFVDSAAT